MRLIIVYGVLLLFTSPALKAQDRNTIHKDLLKLENYCREYQLFNGILRVKDNSGVNYTMVIGDTSNTSINDQSMFNIGSISKQFTATAVLLLQERGKLSLSDPVSNYISGLPSTSKKVTLFHLLTHTSGFRDHYASGIEVSSELNNDHVLQFLRKQENHVDPPGDRFVYSNGGYVLLAMVVEQVSEVRFSDFLKKELFSKAGMDNTFVYTGEKELLEEVVKSYTPTGQLDNDIPKTYGSGNVYSTAHDLVLWDKALSQGEILGLQSRKQAYQNCTLSNGKSTGYGLGWRTEQNGKILHHSGSIKGFRSFYLRIPSSGRSFIILTNHGDVPTMQGIIRAVNSAFEGKMHLPRIPASSLYQLERKSYGITKSIHRTKHKVNGLFGHYYHNESDINNLGYSYLNAKKFEDALALFQWNNTVFSNSWNTYDSMGDAYLAQKDTANAVRFFKESLELNPENKHGVEILKALGYSEAELLPVVQLTQSQLTALEGTYEFNDSFQIKIFLENENQLYSKANDRKPVPIYPASATHFFFKNVDAQFTFEKFKKGIPQVLILHQYGDKKGKRAANE